MPLHQCNDEGFKIDRDAMRRFLLPSLILEDEEEHIKRRPDEHITTDQKGSLLKRAARFGPRLVAHDKPGRD